MSLCASLYRYYVEFTDKIASTILINIGTSQFGTFLKSFFFIYLYIILLT